MVKATSKEILDSANRIKKQEVEDKKAGLLELKISKMEETLANARLIDESQLDSSKVLVLSKVKIKNTLQHRYQLLFFKR